MKNVILFVLVFVSSMAFSQSKETFTCGQTTKAGNPCKNRVTEAGALVGCTVVALKPMYVLFRCNVQPLQSRQETDVGTRPPTQAVCATFIASNV